MLTSAEVAEIKAALLMAQTDIPGLTHSTFLKMADRATHLTYTALGHVLGIHGLHVQGQRRDVTTQVSNGWMEQISVLKSGGEVTFKLHFLESDGTLNLGTGLGAAALAQSLEYFELEYADGSGLRFAAYVDLSFDQPVNSRLSANVTLHLSGAVTAL